MWDLAFQLLWVDLLLLITFDILLKVATSLVSIEKNQQ